MDIDQANQPEWKAWIVKSNQAIKDFRNKENKKQQDNTRINELTRMKDYLEEVLGLLNEKKAKRWNQVHPDMERKEENDDTDKQQKPAEAFFSAWSSNWWAGPVLQEKVPLYEELYEACWNGDDDKIRELCLPPPEGTTRKVAPIQIVCKTTEGGEPCLSSNLILFVNNATVCRIQPAARCDPPSSLVDSEDNPNHCCRSTEDETRAYHQCGLYDV